MRLAAWISRLEAGLDDCDVLGAAALGAARGEHRRDACYVLHADASAGANRLSHGALQTVTAGVAVVLALANHRDKRGERGIAEIETAREAVRAVLLGWEPPGALGPVTYRRGRLLDIASSVLWWQEEYQVEECWESSDAGDG